MNDVKRIARHIVEAVGGISIMGIAGAARHQPSPTPDLEAQPAGGDQEGRHGATPHTVDRPADLAWVELVRMGWVFAGWLLAVVALAETALGHGDVAWSLEMGSKFAVAFVFLTYSTVAALAADKTLSRGIAMFGFQCVLLASGDAVRIFAPAAIASRLARALAFTACSESICAAGMLSQITETVWAKHIRSATLAVFIIHTVFLVAIGNGLSPVFVIFDVVEPLWLCVLCWSQWKAGRVGRKGSMLWSRVSIGFIAIAVGRLLETIMTPSSIGPIAMRTFGLVYAASQYVRFCSNEIYTATGGTTVINIALSES
jgi:hypothetical protein